MDFSLEECHQGHDNQEKEQGQRPGNIEQHGNENEELQNGLGRLEKNASVTLDGMDGVEGHFCLGVTVLVVEKPGGQVSEFSDKPAPQGGTDGEYPGLVLLDLGKEKNKSKSRQ